MIKRLTSLALVVALACTVGGTCVFAGTPPNAHATGDVLETPPASPMSVREVQSNEKLRAGFSKLVADAKAGKVAPAARPQTQPRRSNNLSDGVKVAIGVGIAMALVILVVTHKRGRTYDRDLGCAIAGTC
jgi:hypothetical protein